MGRRIALTAELKRLGLKLSNQEIYAIFTIASAFRDCQMMIPQENSWIILHISDGHITGKEWRHG